MKRARLLPLLVSLLAMLLAGCPLQTSQDGPRIPDTSGTSGNTGSTGGSNGSQGGTATNSGAAGTQPGQVAQTDSQTSAADDDGSGVVRGDTVTDNLSVEFPGCDEPLQAAAWRADVLRLVNEERTARGLGQLVRNETLEQQAVEYACELIHDNFFDHVNPRTGSTLETRSNAAGYVYWMIGENLAAGQLTPEETVQGWMNSPEHRENVLNPGFTELGVGVRTGGEYHFYWVQEFGRPRSAGPYETAK